MNFAVASNVQMYIPGETAFQKLGYVMDTLIVLVVRTNTVLRVAMVLRSTMIREIVIQSMTVVQAWMKDVSLRAHGNATIKIPSQQVGSAMDILIVEMVKTKDPCVSQYQREHVTLERNYIIHNIVIM